MKQLVTAAMLSLSVPTSAFATEVITTPAPSVVKESPRPIMRPTGWQGCEQQPVCTVAASGPHFVDFDPELQQLTKKEMSIHRAVTSILMQIAADSE